MQQIITKTVIAMVAGLGLSGSVIAAQDTSKMSVEQRLSRMEQLLNSQGLVDLLLKVESLQTELQRLQGQNEEQEGAPGETEEANGLQGCGCARINRLRVFEAVQHC